MNKVLHIIPCLLLLFLAHDVLAQADTTRPAIRMDSLSKVADSNISNKKAVDSVLRVHSPRKAAFRSAVVPGWGQVYNGKIWKVPIIYGALGVTGGVFVYNLGNYKDLRFAYRAKFVARTVGDSTDYFKIRKNLLRLGEDDLRYYRDEFRRNIDYTVLVFILFWGLNVVDATVDAHLKSFDVSPDLSFRVKPGYSELARTSGISFVLAFK